jgi:penicillin-binding protein A
MNKQISRIAVAALAMIAALIAATTYWQTWASGGLADRQDNQVKLVASYQTRRGLILSEHPRVVFAANRVRKTKGDTFYFRRYPVGGLAAQTVGYSTTGTQTGLERSENDYLTGQNNNLSTLVRRLKDKLRGATITGNDVVLTLRPGVQRLALNRLDQLDHACGSVVALDPRSGRVLVMASSPTYNPNDVESHFRRIEAIRAHCSPAAPLFNRATQAHYVPGSTFKVVTATAALDSGKVTPNTLFSDPGYCIEYGKRVSNASNPDTGPEAFGTLTFSQGLIHSVNSVFCNTGKRIGAARILDYAKRFGFYRKPPLETPPEERSSSGLYARSGKLFDPKDPATQVDPGRLAFGQERLEVTPLQMAMVASAVANHGVLMKPFVVDRIVAPNGDVVTRTKPSVFSRPMKPQTAAELTTMMEGVVNEGTGTAAQMSVPVAGKTGTAETGKLGNYTSWFIAFAPADNPRVAVAVALENQTQAGGVVAAPIARDILQALLSTPSNS